MFKALNKFFDSNASEIKKLLPIVEEINSLEDEMKRLKDSDFKKKTEDFRKRLQKGENVFLILPEAFALVREAARRVLGERHYDVQLIAAATLAQGKVAEQKTGEGKTLSAVPALYLHSLTGSPVHLVTVNDYLARRDAGWMGAVFALLGVSVASIISEKSYVYDEDFVDREAKDYRLVHLRSISRKEAYEQDVLYGINSEFGFDYLRDNMVSSKDEIVQKRGHYFAVIDEVDSVLIDEARTPHIISMPDATPSNKYYEYARVIDKLSADTDYKIDEKLRTAHLTEDGISKIENLFGVRDIYEKDFDTVYHIEAALKARTLFHIDRDYIVRDNQVILVDEFTGRLLEGRRLSEGLHQAIEAKENVPIQQESKTLATVSLQNYFRMYEKLSGMTGTALTEAEEFHKIYKLDVLSIPTNKPMIRRDMTDQIYKTAKAKVSAIVVAIEEAHKKGQPVLVGTTSIEKNEEIASLLKKKRIIHEVLNAKNHEGEALIIRDAGRLGAVTVATNMAGRGVDILLGGQPPSKFEIQYQSEKGKKDYEKERQAWEKEHAEVKKAGGLLVIGTEKHESRRIDNQLRGRSGRQGDPGASVFIISLEDDLMRIFGGEQISGLMTRFNFPEETPLSHPLVTRVITQAQVKVEGFNFESRKSLLDYDDVLNKQREIIYKVRRGVIENEEEPVGFVLNKVRDEVGRIVDFATASDQGSAPSEIVNSFTNIIPFDEKSREQIKKQIEQNKSRDETIDFLVKIAEDIEKAREKQYGREVLNHISRVISLSAIDNLWMEHLTSMEDLRTGIRLRGYGQRDPLIEYKNEAFGIFERLIASIDDMIVTRFFKVSIQQGVAEEGPRQVFLNQPEIEIGEAAARRVDAPNVLADAGISVSGSSSNVSSKQKPGRNDPCWCGSGKKYKKCHYPN